MSDYNLDTIIEALDYYQKELDHFRNNEPKAKFYFVMGDLQEEFTQARSLMGTLKSKDPQPDVTIPQNKELICSALECYKKGIEKITENLQGELKTKPAFTKTKEKIGAINTMIEKICDGEFHIPEKGI